MSESRPMIPQALSFRAHPMTLNAQGGNVPALVSPVLLIDAFPVLLWPGLPAAFLSAVKWTRKLRSRPQIRYWPTNRHPGSACGGPVGAHNRSPKAGMAIVSSSAVSALRRCAVEWLNVRKRPRSLSTGDGVRHAWALQHPLQESHMKPNKACPVVLRKA